jgi:GMP synthase-like glutamine amidotransferase
MRPRVVFLYQVPHENGGIFLEVAKERAEVIEVNAFETRLGHEAIDADAVIIMGGPMNVDEIVRCPFLKDELRLISERAKKSKSILGICLGAQLIAKALGGLVTKNRIKEIGWYDFSLTQHGESDPCLKHLVALKRVFQWHGDTFSLPQGAKHLVQSSQCAYQAFVYQKNIYGLQFHLEVSSAMIDTWLSESGNVAELKETPAISAAKIRQETLAYAPALQAAGAAFFNAYLDGLV